MSDERFTVTLPISQAQADVAGAPIEIIERIVRSIGSPQIDLMPFIPFNDECQCVHPMVRCDNRGCNCMTCGKPARP